MWITMRTIFRQVGVMGARGRRKARTFLCDGKHVKSVEKVLGRVVLDGY